MLEIKVNSRWVTVTWYIFRSWTGPRKLDGMPYYGPAVELGRGYVSDRM